VITCACRGEIRPSLARRRRAKLRRQTVADQGAPRLRPGRARRDAGETLLAGVTRAVGPSARCWRCRSAIARPGPRPRPIRQMIQRGHAPLGPSDVFCHTANVAQRPPTPSISVQTASPAAHGCRSPQRRNASTPPTGAMRSYVRIIGVESDRNEVIPDKNPYFERSLV